MRAAVLAHALPPGPASRSRFPWLTERQFKVLGLVRAGCTNREICARLGIRSTNGVSDHLLALARKGAIEATKEKGKPGRYALTAIGLDALGLAPCPTCHGRGTVGLIPKPLEGT